VHRLNRLSHIITLHSEAAFLKDCRVLYVIRTEYQYAFDHAKRSGKSLSAYMRELATTGRMVANNHTTDAPLVSFELINQLQKVGVNINQLTRVAHATGGELPKALANAGEDLLSCPLPDYH